MASAHGAGGTRRVGPAAGSGKPKLRKGERQKQLVSLSPTFVCLNKSVTSRACYLDLSGLSVMSSWVFKWDGHMTYCPKWGSRNKREPFDEQAGALCTLSRGVVGFMKVGKWRVPLCSHRALTEGVQQGSGPTVAFLQPR